MIKEKCVIYLQVLNVGGGGGQDCKDSLGVGGEKLARHVGERERKGERGGVVAVIKMFYDGKRGRKVWVEAGHKLRWYPRGEGK